MREKYDDEKEKCLEKLNEMQTFLPFLDFMIDKIRRKNVLPLECQLSKFQHIRSVIIEKNTKYSLEGLTNIEDILQKLITKLDYKGVVTKQKRESADVKPPVEEITIVDEHASVNSPNNSEKNATATTSFANIVNSVNKAICKTPKHASGTVEDMVIGSSELPDGNSRENIRKSENSNVEKSYSVSNVNSVTEINSTEKDCAPEKCTKRKNESETVRRYSNETSNHNINYTRKSIPASDVLASSRKKLLKSVCIKSRKGEESHKTRDLLGDCDNKGVVERDSQLKRSFKPSNELVSDSIFSDISDDEETLDKISSLSQKHQTSVLSNSKSKSNLHNVPSYDDDICIVSEYKINGSAAGSGYNSLGDIKSKQKLRERLSADIAEVYKVPGKSVGGSLRSLKDLKGSSKEHDCTYDRLKDSHRSQSSEKQSKDYRDKLSESVSSKIKIYGDRDLNKSAGKDHRHKYEKKLTDRRKDEKYHRRAHREHRKEHSIKKCSSLKDKNVEIIEKPHRSDGKKEKRKKKFEIDELNDEELGDFVKKNMSSFPYLSKLEPTELRKTAKFYWSLLVENVAYSVKPKERKESSTEKSTDDRNLSEDKAEDDSKHISDLAPVETQFSSSYHLSDRLSNDTQKNEASEQSATNEFDDEDEYARNLIDETTPNPSTLTNSNQVDLSTIINTTESQINKIQGFLGTENKDTVTQQRSSDATQKLTVDTSKSRDSRTVHSTSLIQKSPTDNLTSAVYSNLHNDRSNRDPRLLPCSKSSEKTFMGSRYSGGIQQVVQPVGHNAPGTTNYVPYRALSYGEYKKLRRLESDEKSKHSSNDKGAVEEAQIELSNDNNKINQLLSASKSTTSKVKDSSKALSNNKSTTADNKNKARAVQISDQKFTGDVSRKPADSGRDQGNFEKLSTKLSDDEFVSPLDKLYENNSKPVTGRGYGLQNFKIPKKGKFSGKDNNNKSQTSDCTLLPKESSCNLGENSTSVIIGQNGGSWTSKDHRENESVDSADASTVQDLYKDVGSAQDVSKRVSECSNISPVFEEEISGLTEVPNTSTTSTTSTTDITQAACIVTSAVNNTTSYTSNTTTDTRSVSSIVNVSATSISDVRTTAFGVASSSANTNSNSTAVRDDGYETVTTVVDTTATITETTTSKNINDLNNRSSRGGKSNDSKCIEYENALGDKISYPEKDCEKIDENVNSGNNTDENEIKSREDINGELEEDCKRLTKTSVVCKMELENVGGENENSSYTVTKCEDIDPKSKMATDSNKSLLTEEITQELVEALISKSFQSGEGELLLAKAKLFKELALKLNSKKLKTIQKIINSESDSSSSSSDSLSDCEKKKKKVRKKRVDCVEKTSKNKKKVYKSKQYIESSTDDNDSEDNGNHALGTYNLRKSAEEITNKEDEEAHNSEKLNKDSSSENKGKSPEKKSQRKTKLLEQVLNESPRKDFDLVNQTHCGKDTDQKVKPKPKSKAKTELDRLHDDIRSMFICSGVVTATGQRMCRILRQSGGKVNNLDLVKESAKMVEEEKLKCRKTRRQNAAAAANNNNNNNNNNCSSRSSSRSRSRSLERKKTKDCYRSSSLIKIEEKTVVNESCDRKEVVKSELNNLPAAQPYVLLDKINVERWSYAYKIRDFPKSYNMKRGRNVARRGRCGRFFMRSGREEQVSLLKRNTVYLERNLRKALAAKTKRTGKKYKVKKLAHIIQNLPLKMAKIKHLEICERVSTPKLKAEEQPASTCNSELKKRQKQSKNGLEDTTILDYSFNKSRTIYSCRLCPYLTKTITSHYKTEHPESEVLISRLERSEAKKAIEDSIANKYGICSLEQASSLEMIKKRVKSKLTETTLYMCRMCNYSNVNNLNYFFNHISTHTGEYRYKCPAEGCSVIKASRDGVKTHIAMKHAMNRVLIVNIIELFPLPNEYGNLFGYLCSLCNFIQVFRKNVENHVLKMHSTSDVRIIKIDLSRKCDSSKKSKKVNRRRIKKRKKLYISQSSDQDDDEGDFEDEDDEDYCYNSNNDHSYSSNDYEDEDDNDTYKRKRKRRKLLKKQKHKLDKAVQLSSDIEDHVDSLENDNSDNKISVTEVTTTSSIPDLISISSLKNDCVSKVGEVDSTSKESVEAPLMKVEVKPLVEEDAGSVEHGFERTVKVGPLEAVILKGGSIIYKCTVPDCHFSSSDFTAFDDHILKNHLDMQWNGGCEVCGNSKESEVEKLQSVAELLEHMQSHIKVFQYDIMLSKTEIFEGSGNVSDEDARSSRSGMDVTDVDPCSESQVSAVELKKETADNENLSYPIKPLLRVRSLVGDRLSTPKADDEMINLETPVKTDSVKIENTEVKNAEEVCLFKINDVRSLKPDMDGNSSKNENTFGSQEFTEKFPPNAKVISGKPVLIRSCPSPKIAIRSETSIIPIPSTPTKQTVEVGQIKVVHPNPSVPSQSEASSVGFNQLITSAPVQIISPSTLKSPTLIVPTYSTSRLVPNVSISKPGDKFHSITIQHNKNILPQPVSDKPVLLTNKSSGDHKIHGVEGDNSNLENNSLKKRILPKPATHQILPQRSVFQGSTIDISDDKNGPKRHQPNSNTAVKNIKDANIYKEMLTKKKLCQLFKCMAVECSFTCNSDSIFTQHIGLHEAQQRIKGKRKPSSKNKTIFTWKQCAYCCEVLPSTGSALSHHILMEHGHCLYQCAYCFYRAVSEIYVDLHQIAIHQNIPRVVPRKIYKCRPVPGAVASKPLEKQAKPHNVRPYQCEHCSSKFFLIPHFVEHLNKEHPLVTGYTCHICKLLCLKVDRLISHYKLHSFSMYQCAYCLHGAESQQEMLYHLCNFHFSQPPLICVRALDSVSSIGSRKFLRDIKKKKCDNIALDDLKVITFENNPFNTNHFLEEVESEVDQDSENKGSRTVPISVDLSTIVSELGIDVEDDPKNTASSKKIVGKSESDLAETLPIESMLPNAQFSSELDNPDENCSLLISSGVKTVITQNKETNDVDIPLGQLPIQVLKLKGEDAKAVDDSTASKSKTSKEVKEIDPTPNITAATVTPHASSGKKTNETQNRGMHKLPPIVTPNQKVKVYPSKKLMIINKTNEFIGELKEGAPILFQHLSASPNVAASQSVILALPVLGSSKNVSISKPTDDSSGLPSIQSVVSLKPSEHSECSVNKENGNQNTIENERCQLQNKNDTLPLRENSLPKICDVRSLSNEKEIANNDESSIIKSSVLQPPIIRIEDFKDNKTQGMIKNKPLNNPASNAAESEAIVQKQITSNNKESLSKPTIPEIIIIDEEEDDKKKSEFIEVLDVEEDDLKKENATEEAKRSLNEKDVHLEIRKQIEQLRNQIQETDCLLLDDSSQEGDTSNSMEIISKRDESKSQQSVKSASPAGDGLCTDSADISLDNHKETHSESKVITPHTEDGAMHLKTEVQSETPADNKVDLNDKGEKNLELSGKSLFICGNGKCYYTAENDTDLKEHLYVCDLSRESSVLVCPHCSKQLKNTAAYIEHVKLHGEKRFRCGLCDFSSASGANVTRHMKQKHKNSQPKFMSNCSVKPGYYVIYPKNYKKVRKDAEVMTFSPGDEDKLPLQAIYQVNVQCAKCPYFTKVRSNMVRHLKIHIKSVETEGSIVVPSTAPTNPVPCLDTKEKMFDKMTNLAASSQLAQAKEKIDALTPEEEAKLPHFVPEQMRHKCCSPDCNYVTIDDNMLRHHIKALHDEINVYSCPHCKETVHLEFRFVPLEKIGQHLKFHDSKLYKCYHCLYFHYQKYVVEKHVFEKHPERRFHVYTVREPKVEPAIEEELVTPNENIMKVWKCGLCDNFESEVRLTVLEHLSKVHNTKSKYKCKFCDMKSSQLQAFEGHFASKHNGEQVQFIRALIQISRVCDESPNQLTPITTNHFDTTPLWQRGAPRVRHIRGILIEEEEIKTKRTKKVSGDIENEVNPPNFIPPESFYCPLCTDKKKVFYSKNAENFRIHLYQELNYQQFACILCGKMFVDKRDFDKHHSKVHPNKLPELKQTVEDSEIKFWVDKVIAKQKNQILDRKRRLSSEDTLDDPQPPKKKKIQGKMQKSLAQYKEAQKKSIGKIDKVKRSRSNSSEKSNNESEADKVPKPEVHEKSENVRLTRSSANQSLCNMGQCPHCRFKSYNVNDLKSHIKLSHLKMGKWLCPYCGVSFEMEKSAIKHCKNEHPGEQVNFIPNPDAEETELSEEFWFEEYGFGQGTGKSVKKRENVGVPERVKSASASQGKPPSDSTSNVVEPKNESRTTTKSDINVYACGYCLLETRDQSSIMEHLENHHEKTYDRNIEPGVVGTLHYQCNVCKERMNDFEGLSSHAKERHPGITLQFDIRKVFKHNSFVNMHEVQCSLCGMERCTCSSIEKRVSGENCYRCPRCATICNSYLDCIDHFNDHYPRYTCRTCSQRFYTEEEVSKHQSDFKHSLPYTMAIPSEKMLDEYKSGVTIKREGVWVPLQEFKKLRSTNDVTESKLKSMTA